MLVGVIVLRTQVTKSIAKVKESVLHDDLRTMRLSIENYSADQHKRPESLHDLIAAGYLNQLPKDPLTNRRDTWTPEWSTNPASPGVANVRSGASGTDGKGIRYAGW